MKTCTGLSSGDTCTYTGGPYTAYQGTTVSYLANITDTDGKKSTKGYYYFGVTDGSYNWSSHAIPARHVGSSSQKIDFFFHRANDYGARFDEYAAGADREIAVVTMVESREAVEHIEEILAVEDLDGVFVGPYDLSGSYGVVGRTGDALVVEAIGRVADACRRTGKAAGIHVVIPDPGAIRRAIADGFTFIALGMDDVFLDAAARQALAVAREAVLRPPRATI